MVLTSGVHGPELAPTELLVLNLVILSACFVLLCKPSFGNRKGVLILSAVTLLAASSRVILEPFPNVQPLTVMCLIMGATLGARRGMAFAIMATILSNMVLSHGLWTLYQASGWAIIAFVGSKANIIIDSKLNMKILLAYSVAASFLFDWWVSLSIITMETSLAEFMIYLLNGIPFDILHAVASIATALWLAPHLVPLLDSEELDCNEITAHGEADVIIA